MVHCIQVKPLCINVTGFFSSLGVIYVASRLDTFLNFFFFVQKSMDMVTWKESNADFGWCKVQVSPL